jgi:hypothetical protein
MANVIQVVPDGKNKWKVLVDYIQCGVSYHSPALANHIAEEVRDKHHHFAILRLAKVPKQELVKV